MLDLFNNMGWNSAKLTFLAQVPCNFSVLTGCVFALAAYWFRAVDMNIFIGHTVTTFDPTGQTYRPFLWQLLKVCAVLFIPENEIKTYIE